MLLSQKLSNNVLRPFALIDSMPSCNLAPLRGNYGKILRHFPWTTRKVKD